MLEVLLMCSYILLLILPTLRWDWLLLLILALHRLLLLLAWCRLRLISSSDGSSFLELFLLLFATRLRIRVTVRILLPLIESFVFSVGMAFEVSHVLVNIDSFEAVLFKLSQETFYDLREFREIFLDVSLILLVLPLNVDKELLEMVRIVHDELVNYGLMKVDTWKLIRITFNDHRCHSSKVSGD